MNEITKNCIQKNGIIIYGYRTGIVDLSDILWTVIRS